MRINCFRRKTEVQKNCSVGPVRLSPSGKRIDFDVSVGPRNFHVYYSSKNTVLAPSVEATIAATLLPIMVGAGGRCELEGSGSEGFLTSVERIQDIYSWWLPRSHRVTFMASLVSPQEYPETKRTAAFFSAGVDSFFTLLKHEKEIADLIFVHGFDISVNQQNLYGRAVAAVKRVGEQLNKNVIEVETNVRSLLDPYVPCEMSHGAALASVGHLLSARVNKIYIASSYTYANLHPWGTHPFLDPLWSTECLEFIHHGCETDRTEKTFFLAEHDIALRNLRVCWQNPQESYNCGKCRKCLITMIDLYAAGMLDRCPTFDTPIHIRNVRNIDIEGNNFYSYLKGSLLALEKKDLDPELRRAVVHALQRKTYMKKMGNLIKMMVKDTARKVKNLK